MPSKSFIIYIAIAVFVAAGTFVAVSMLSQSPYDVKVSLVYQNSSTVYPFMTTLFAVHVDNLGASAISGLSVNLYENGQIFRAYDVSLPPHKNATINTTYTYMAIGNYTFKAVADPGMVLNMKNRQNSQSIVNVIVRAPEIPDLYKFIPNNNINYTNSFVLYPSGIAFASLLEGNYNITSAHFFGPPYNIISNLLISLSQYMSVINGAYASYSDKTAVYGAWLQGSLNSSYIQTIISTYRPAFKERNFTLANTNVSYVKLSNSTSMCFMTNLGWTKLLVYYNNSQNQTCASVISKTYYDNESSLISNALKEANKFVRYASNFTYVNSTTLASSISYRNGSISSLNLFNNSYGFFGAYLRKNTPQASTNRSSTCYGLIFNSSNASVCSVYVPSTNGSIRTHSLINTTEITSNYTFTMYAFVNNTYLTSAHSSAVKLIEYLNISEPKLLWSLLNTCLFNTSAGIGCKLLNFNRTSSNVIINITNNLPYEIAFKDVYCGLGGIGIPTPINSILATGSSTVLTTTCFNIPLPIFGTMTNYFLMLNYTHENETLSAMGTVAVTNI